MHNEELEDTFIVRKISFFSCHQISNSANKYSNLPDFTFLDTLIVSPENVSLNHFELTLK